MSEIDVWIPVQPDATLSPNSRAHWRKKASVVRETRESARLCTTSALARHTETWPKEGGVFVQPTILWGKGRKTMDGDNAVAILKAYLDGVADGLGVDDRTFVVDSVTQVRAAPGLPGVVLRIRSSPTP